MNVQCGVRAALGPRESVQPRYASVSLETGTPVSIKSAGGGYDLTVRFECRQMGGAEGVVCGVPELQGVVSSGMRLQRFITGLDGIVHSKGHGVWKATAVLAAILAAAAGRGTHRVLEWTR